MIRVDRGAEPPAMVKVRSKRLARAMLALASGQEIVFKDYDQCKALLHERQNGKCAYCEHVQPHEDHPVEHFRPKEVADFGDPLARPRTHRADGGRYWWLAWTWENLLFACVTCNGADHKGNWFPLEAGSALRLPGIPECPVAGHASWDLSKERPLLIDPAVDDPMLHIGWVPANPGAAPPDLRWIPVHKTPRGEVTIEVLGFRGWLSDLVTGHIQMHVLPQRIERVLALLSGRKVPAAKALWSEVMDVLFAPRQAFQAATHDAIDYLVGATTRAQFGLMLPRPGAAHPTHPMSSPLLIPAVLQRVNDDILRLRVLAHEEATEDLLADLAPHGPWTTKELAQVLNLSSATVSKHLRSLLAAGRVSRVGPVQWR